MLFFIALFSLQRPFAFALHAPWQVHLPRPIAFSAPANSGGSQFANTGGGSGEPLNVIISGLSSPDVLTDDGIINWARSVGFSKECLGLHLGGLMTADLGDGNGAVNQLGEIRQDYGNSALGTCLESLIGGNHFRYWRQNGTLANTGAVFLAVSQEEDLNYGHTISPNGYDVGRDELVNLAIDEQTSFHGVTYRATNETITGLLPVGSVGVNHGISLDGNVSLLTITIV